MLGAYKCRSKEKDDREMEIEKDLRQNLRDRDESTLPFFCLGGGGPFLRTKIELPMITGRIFNRNMGKSLHQ